MFRRILAVLPVLVAGLAFAQPILVPRAEEFADRGKSREAAALLRSVMRDSTYRWSSAEQATLAFELDRLRRIRFDYQLTRDELFAQLQRSIVQLSSEEFEGWLAEGRFDSRVFDDTLRFLGVSRSNLFWRYPALNSRLIRKSDDSASQRRLYEACMAIVQTAGSSRSSYVLPKKFTATSRVTTDSGTVPPGATVRVWLPVPREYPYQKEFSLNSSSAPGKALARGTSPIRSAYFEVPADGGGGAQVSIRFSFTRYGIRFPLDPAEARPFDGGDSVAGRYVQEGPHVVFTEKIRKLSDQLVGTEVNPLIKAKRFHDWISEHIQYSYAREYSTIRNLGDYCLTNRFGDCGQHALLFITLCRYSGIPARWQSGWYTFPGEMTIHDWAEIFVEPYGWIPVDPDMGIFAMQYFTTLAPEERKQLRDFFFGGMDQYRMAANADHCQELAPTKRTYRSDPVDFQRGEIEYEGGNIYFDRFSYAIECEEQKK